MKKSKDNIPTQGVQNNTEDQDEMNRRNDRIVRNQQVNAQSVVVNQVQQPVPQAQSQSMSNSQQNDSDPIRHNKLSDEVGDGLRKQICMQYMRVFTDCFYNSFQQFQNQFLQQLSNNKQQQSSDNLQQFQIPSQFPQSHHLFPNEQNLQILQNKKSNSDQNQEFPNPIFQQQLLEIDQGHQNNIGVHPNQEIYITTKERIFGDHQGNQNNQIHQEIYDQRLKSANLGNQPHQGNSFHQESHHQRLKSANQDRNQAHQGNQDHNSHQGINAPPNQLIQASLLHPLQGNQTLQGINSEGIYHQSNHPQRIQTHLGFQANQSRNQGTNPHKNLIHQGDQTHQGNQFQALQPDQLLRHILKFDPQIENNIQKDLKCFLFDQIFMEEIKMKIKNSQLDVEIRLEKDSSYVINYKKVDEAKGEEYVRIIEKKINQTVILTNQCQSEQEVRVKLKILNNLRHQLQNIFLSKEFKVDTLLDYQNLSEGIIDLGQRNVIFVIINQEAKISIKDLQDQFNRILITDNNYINYLEDYLEIQLNNEPNLIDLQKEQEELNKEDFCIIFHPPLQEHKKNSYKIQIKFQLWMMRNHQQDKRNELEIMKNRLLKMKDLVSQLYFTQVKMELNFKESKIWEYFLSSYISKQDIKFIIQKQPFVISLKGERALIQIKKEEIESFLKILDYKSLRYNISEESFRVLSKQQMINIFKQDLNEIQQEFQAPYVQVSQFDQAEYQIMFEIICDTQNIQILKKFIKSSIVTQIKTQFEDYNLTDLLQYHKKSQQQFEEQYNCYIYANNGQGFHIVTLQKYLDKLIDRLNQFKNTLNSDKYNISINDIQNDILFEEVEKKVNSIKRQPFTQVAFQKIPNVVKITGPKQYALQEEVVIRNINKEYNNKLHTKRISMFKKQWEYLENRLKNEMDKIKYDFKCCFQVSNSQDFSLQEAIHEILSLKGKQIIIKCGDIIKQKCDAIINSCNNSLIFDDITSMSGVAKVIFQFGGAQYQQFAKDHKKKNNFLSGPILFKIPNPQHINAIISVPTQHYVSAGQDLEQFRNNIIKIFKIAEKEKYKSLVIPILGGESASFFFPTACRSVLTNVIEQILHSKFVEKVIIIEINSQKVEMILKTLYDILYPPIQRQIKYQWQFFNKNWIDYDDFEINQQIDEGYEQYLNDKSKCQIEINFPYTKQPGTHKIDLNKMTITDIALDENQPISIKQQQNGQKYHFHGQSVNDSLNEYIELQKSNHIMVFEIFLKKYKIIFGKKDIIQVNLKTNYERKVKYSKNYKQMQVEQEQTVSLLDKVQFDLQIEQPSTFQTNSLFSIDILSFDANKMHDIDNKITDLLDLSQKTFYWKVKNFKDVDLISIENIIKEESIKVTGQIKQGNELEITCFKEGAIKLENQLDQFEQQSIIFPQEWIYQSQNLIKVQLNKQDQDYKNVQEQFYQTYPQGKIYQINRIQNKVLYENFLNEKRKLIQLKQTQGQTLSQDQLSRYLWHGVKGQHPSIIYDSLQEAFKINYCNATCRWGPGIYFAGQALYSKDYAYTLTPQQSADYPNKLIFLLCEVVTGKCANLAPNNDLKEPPKGYDCVIGKANISDIYVLYGMDVRRAYPSFEIIFE